MRFINHLLAVAASGILSAQTITTHTAPIGFNKVVCLPNSDTIVGVPFRMEGSVTTLTTDVPGIVEGSPDLAVISVQASIENPGSLGQHYLKFEGGVRDGRWYDITGNTASSVTIDLNGDNLTGVAAGNRVVIIQYWTLDTLFPPDQATTSWTEDAEKPGQWIQDGNAIVASITAFPSGRRTEVLFPNYAGTGINLSTSGTYYIHNGGWRRHGKPMTTDFGSVLLVPDYFFNIRHSSSVSKSTTLRASGEVGMEIQSIPLNTRNDTRQDNFIALKRPVNVTLDELSLGGTQGFVSSTTAFPSGRRDELLVFSNEVAARNKSASATYYHFNGAWRRHGRPITNNYGGDHIPAAFGFIVRKYQTVGGETAFWSNPPSY